MINSFKDRQLETVIKNQERRVRDGSVSAQIMFLISITDMIGKVNGYNGLSANDAKVMINPLAPKVYNNFLLHSPSIA